MGKHVPVKGEYLKLLVGDQTFQQRFAADKELDRLEAERCNPVDEMNELITVLGGQYQIDGCDGFAFAPPAAGIIAVLAACQSPFVNGGELTVMDIDAALYLLHKGKSAFKGDPATLYTDAAGFCNKIGANTYDAATAIESALKLAFRAFKMFPSAGNEEKNQHYDADWLTSIVAMVSKVTNLRPDYIIWKLPFTSAGYYICQYCRQMGQQHIEKRADREVVEQIFERTFEMICERLDELKITNYLSEELPL